MASGYYINKREEMLQFIPNSCKRILEVGCGDGIFAESVKNKFNAEVWGVELSEDAAKKAEKVIDKVFTGDIIELVNTLPANYFDCIVINDVLEHILDPFKLLSKIKSLIKNNGYIVSSIPNVRYIGNLEELLLKKDWQYKDDGILDITHFRFFTKKSIERMFTNAGYKIVSIEGINPTGSIKVKLLGWLSFGLFADAKFMQFATVARCMNS
jgi:2-polyprenyl-3-methyl-5-hydroxy-6-metoxy-1,4-benzoquinol methylase